MWLKLIMCYGHFLLTLLFVGFVFYTALQTLNKPKWCWWWRCCDSVVVAMFNSGLRVLFKQAISGFCNVYICNWNVARNQLASICLSVCMSVYCLRMSLSAWVGGFWSFLSICSGIISHSFLWLVFLLHPLPCGFLPCDRHERLTVYSNHFQELSIPLTWWSHFSLSSSCSPFVCLTALYTSLFCILLSARVLFQWWWPALANFRQFAKSLNHDYFRFLINLYRMQKNLYY